MNLPAFCAQFDSANLQEPVTRAEFTELQRVRKAFAYHPRGTGAFTRWQLLVCRQETQYPTTPLREATHEAGHAVVIHHLGWAVTRIYRDADGALKTDADRPTDALQRDLDIVEVAGYLAETRIFERTDPGIEASNVAEAFMRRERDHGRKTTHAARIAQVEAAEARAMTILADHWEAVGRVARLALDQLPVERPALLEALSNEPRTETRDATT